MPKISVHNAQGKAIGETELNDKLFGLTPKVGLMHRKMRVEQAHQRHGTHDTLTRAEVAGGGRKPWKQKHTGRARQGTIRAPHWRKGGVAHGPHPRDHEITMSKKEKRLALASALSAKFQAGDLILVDDLGMTEIKTKRAMEILSGLGAKDKKVLILLGEHNETVWKSFRNLPNVQVKVAPGFSLVELLSANTIIATQSAVQAMEEVWAR